MYLLGLFYKTSEPKDLLSVVYRIFQESIEEESGVLLTPVQSSINKHVASHKFFSFSAPTSTGKSHVLRELIHKSIGDIVIVLPSRALISEYLLTIRDIVKGRKDVLLLQFIDNINKEKARKRIFVITPERGGDLFRLKDNFDVGLFIFDEAQISEEGTRGLTFDALVRRCERYFPEAKKVFVHPFVENPEAQLQKHGFLADSSSEVFRQSAVGKMFIQWDKSLTEFRLFSPFIDNPHLKKNQYSLPDDPVSSILRSGGSILVYVSKQFIYERRYEEEFGSYIRLCAPIENPEALKIVDEVERLIGAAGQNSELIRLMKRGIITHHGSIPLVVRYLIEAFANRHFVRICFATSTLAQGVNIPFDLVWIHNLRFYGTDENKTLGLKNLIGRAGRTSKRPDSFDFGYVVVSNCKRFVERFLGETTLKPASVLDEPASDFGPDVQEFIDAIKNDTMNEEYSLPEACVRRVATQELDGELSILLELLFRGDRLLTGDEYYSLADTDRERIKVVFAHIFEVSLGRELTSAEISVLSTAISILLWQVQGRSFRTLIGLRYSYLTKRAEQREVNRLFRQRQITADERRQRLEGMSVRFSPIAGQLPDIKLRSINRFGGHNVLNVNYDLIVYDTYDYIDKVISFSLSDVYVATFDQYFNRTSDARALSFANFIRYGSSDPTAILLIRYGFSPENIEQIIPHIQEISDQKIVFRATIDEVEDIFDEYLIDHYR